MSIDHKPLVAVLGPTGSGKSDLALKIAETFQGEIVNADSVQMYRGFDIGSAKTPVSERRGIPHYLIDVLEPEEICSAGEYSGTARATIQAISNRGRLPVIAGGTGFYVRALFEGLFAGPGRDSELRAALAKREQRSPGFLHRALRRADAVSAARVHPNDRNKLIRALEVCLLTRRPITDLFATGRDPLKGYSTLKIGLNPPRQLLYTLLDERSSKVFAALVEEVQGLLHRGVPATAKPFESIGYKQALRLVRGETTKHEALAEMCRDTRRYSKRQLTWLRREHAMHWLSAFGTDETTQRSIVDTVSNFLRTGLQPAENK